MVWEYVLLGILQGLFEWVPVSSEGVVAVVAQWFSFAAHPVDVALFLHLGTLGAVLVFFRREWKEVVLWKDKRLGMFLVVTATISLVVGYPLYHVVKDVGFGRSLLVLTGVGLLLTAVVHAMRKSFGLKWNSIVILSGVLQGLAVIPGLSRSGVTVFGLSLGDLSSKEVLKLSYMMSAPVVAVAALYVALASPAVFSAWPGVVVSFVVGLLSLKGMMVLAERLNMVRLSLVFAMLCFVGFFLG